MASEGGEGFRPIRTTTSRKSERVNSKISRRKMLAGAGTAGLGVAAFAVLATLRGLGDRDQSGELSVEPVPKGAGSVIETYPYEFRAIFHDLDKTELREVEELVLRSRRVLLGEGSLVLANLDNI